MSKLTARDKDTLHCWIRNGASLAEIESVSRIGLVGNERFNEAARTAFIFLWTWSAPRFAGRAGRLQDNYYTVHGSDGLMRRINRVRRLIGHRPL
jgi:hypothetical protein